MNNTMRIAMECQPLNLWFEESPNGTGVSWHGRTAWQFADLKFRIGILALSLFFSIANNATL